MIHNISIATDNDIIQLGDDVKYTLYIYQGNYHLGKTVWLEKTIVIDHILVNFL